MSEIIPNELYSVFITETNGVTVIADVYKIGDHSKMLHRNYQSEARAIASIKQRLRISPDKKCILLHRQPWLGRIETVGWV